MTELWKAHDYSRTIATVMKDEAPYMLDWIAYHRAIGFTHFVILTNDCSDGTEKICRKLERAGLVTHKNNPSPHPRGPQKTGYQRMLKLIPIQEADWLMTLDVDEYLRIDIGDGTLDGLFQYFKNNPNAYSFVWQIYGNNQVDGITSNPVWQDFPRSQHPLQSRPYEVLSIKTLYRAKFFERLGTHRPVNPIAETAKLLHWIDADGVPMVYHAERRHWRAYENGIGFGSFVGRINHYALRSLDGFMVKWERGFVHPDAPTVRGKGKAEDYWKLFNWNQFQDPHQLRKIEQTQLIRAALESVENIAKISNAGLEWHQSRAQKLKSEFPERYEHLKAMGDSRIDEPMPDFSHHGSPPSLNQLYVPTSALLQKAKLTTISRPELLDHHYGMLEASTQ